MEFGGADRMVAELYPGDSLSFPPTAPTVASAKARDLTNRSADGDSLDISDSPENPKVHGLKGARP